MRMVPALHPDTQPSLEALARQAEALAASLASVADYSPGVRRSLSDSHQGLGDEAALAETARHCLKARRLREALFAPGLFCDPAWDLLLDLFASEVEGRHVCVSDASIAANVPQTTGLRWLEILGKHGLVVRTRDPQDGRRSFVALAPEARAAMATWLRSAFPC